MVFLFDITSLRSSSDFPRHRNIDTIICKINLYSVYRITFFQIYLNPLTALSCCGTPPCLHIFIYSIFCTGMVSGCSHP